MKNGRWLAAVAGIASFWVSTQSQAAGFEKNVLWSGKHGGVAGAGVVGMGGAESIFFNPAEMIAVEKAEVSANVSPTTIQLKGPWAASNTSVTGKSQFVPITGLAAAYRLTPQLAVGLGAYVGGGARALYENVDFSAVNTSPLAAISIRPNIENHLDIVEFSPGVSYEVIEGLRLGLAWRLVWVKAKLQTVFFAGSGVSTSFNSLTLDNFSQFKADGFRLGASYDSKVWGIGASLRSPVKFKLKGDVTAGQNNALATATVTNITGTGKVTAENYFPLQINAGTYYEFVPKTFKMMFEYSFNRYSQNTQINFAGATLSGGTLSSQDISAANLRQRWRDFNVWRLGGEYKVSELTAVRAGYALSGNATPEDTAIPSFPPPGKQNTLTAGVGHSLMERALDLDLALEYSWGKGNVSAGELGGFTGTQAVQIGDYKMREMAMHVGATYRF